MKLHKDGTLEGTAKEMAEYQVEYERLIEKKQKPDWPISPSIKEWWRSPTIGVPNPIQPTITCAGTNDIVQMQKEYWDKTSIWNRPSSRLLGGTVIKAQIICKGYKEHELNFEDDD